MRPKPKLEGKGAVGIPRALFGGVFFFSGFAALVYQVVWQRMLVFFSGADVHSSTVIVAVFMAGLGLGSMAGGFLADRISARAALLMFAAAEGCIAVFSVLSRPLYYDWLYQSLGAVGLTPAVMTSILFVSLLWPTLFMGMSLPLLARALTTQIERAATTVGTLYALNTLGAATGAFAATWWALPQFGLDGTLRLGTIINAACALTVLPFRQRLATTAAPALPTRPTGVATNAVGAVPVSLWAAIYAVSGLLALSLEIVWFRLLGVMVKSTSFTFGTLLSIYLLGLGTGALWGSSLAPRVKNPGAVFLLVQGLAGTLAAGLLTVMIGSVSHLEWLHAYFASYDPLSVPESVQQLKQGRLPALFVFLYFGLPSILIGVPTMLMGFSFPILQRIVQTDFARLGRRIGIVLLANIAGSVLGTMATGWVALDTLGTAGTMRVIAMISAVFVIGGLVSWSGSRRTLATAVTGIALLVGLSLVPGPDRLWGRLHGTTPDAMIVGEDASGLSVLRVEPEEASIRTTVFVNGVGQSTIPYGGVHTGLGLLPALLHPSPRTMAIIGLGSGDTVYAAAGRPETEEITCIEIVAPQLPGLRVLRQRYPYGGLTGLLDDPRIQWLDGDGRMFLMREPARFDVIEADALRPSSAYSGNLYSEEYFRLVRSRLRPQGLAATWLPTERVHNAFVKVFPHVISVPGILVGSNEPITIDAGIIAQRLAVPATRDHYARAGIDAGQLMAAYLQDPAYYSPDFDRLSLQDVNTDLFPKDEFELSVRR